jgi:HK97 family phage portal protein
LPYIASDGEWLSFLNSKGYAINTDTALKVAVVIRCADVVSKTMASLGCHLYRTAANGKERATDQELYNILRYLPNPETTAYEFWHMYIMNLMLTSGAFAEIKRNKSTGKIIGIYNLPTDFVKIERNSKTNERYLVVTYGNNKTEKIYSFMHTPGIRFKDSENPNDFIKIASEVLELTLDLNGFAKDYFENGSNPGGFIEYPEGINLETFEEFKTSWQKMYSGVKNQHKWAILEGGFKINKMEGNPAAAQALESRKFQILEVCRIMGVTPHKVFELQGVNYNSIEQLNIEFWQETIDPMDERLCQTIYKDLLTTEERKTYFAKFNTNKLLKGDVKARTEYYNTMRQNGVFSANKILDLEDMNQISDEEGGNALLVNGNFISLKNAQNNLPKSMQKGGL